MARYNAWRAKDGSLKIPVDADSSTQACYAWARQHRYLWPDLSLSQVAQKAQAKKVNPLTPGGRPKTFF